MPRTRSPRKAGMNICIEASPDISIILAEVGIVRPTRMQIREREENARRRLMFVLDEDEQKKVAKEG